VIDSIPFIKLRPLEDVEVEGEAEAEDEDETTDFFRNLVTSLSATSVSKLIAPRLKSE